MDKSTKQDDNKLNRSRSPRPRQPRRGGRARSRSPNFRYEDDDLSSNTQRDETHLKRSRIFVGNIEPNAVSRKDLHDTFSRYGKVIAVSVHNGYAFVQLDSEKSANAAVNLENGRTLNGKKINVEFSSAALKAGARFKRLSFQSSRSPPLSPRDVDHGPDPSYYERERRLARILALENELKQEMGYLQREHVDYDLGGGYSRRTSEPVYPTSSYDRPSERLGGYSSRDIERDSRQKSRNEYFDSQRSHLSPSPRGSSYSDYSHRENSSGYRGSTYSRDWDTSKSSSYPSYPGGGSSSGGRQNW